MLRRSSLAAVLLCWLAVLAATADRAPAAPERPFRPFAPDSVWNLRLRDDAPLHLRSARYVRWFSRYVRERGFWVNTTTCTMPTYWAAPGTPRTVVHLDHPSYTDKALVQAWRSVPIPASAEPARCQDRNFAVAQRQPDGTISLWEFWSARRNPDGSWTARWGGVTADMQHDRGIASSRSWQDPSAHEWAARHASAGWNVTASSVSMVAGVVTDADLRSGRIRHALSMATTDAAARRWFWPAQRSDGGLQDRWAIPEGARLRLDPRVRVGALPGPPLVRMLARAAQRYGIVVRDRTFGRNVFMTARRDGAPNLAARLLDGMSSSEALEAFPWEQLELLDAPLCDDWRGCAVEPAARIDLGPGPALAGRRVVLDTANSTLDHPRADVRWDLDGDGDFERRAGAAVRLIVRAPAVASWTVAVRITTTDGRSVDGRRVVRLTHPNGG